MINIKKIPNNLKFLIITIGLIAVIGLFNSTLSQEIIIELWGLLKQITPVLVFVFFMMFILNIFLKPKFVAKHLSKGSGFKSWMVTIIGGILSMGPIYAWYPLLGELKNKGMSNALITAFIYNKAIKIQLLPMLIYYFGLPFTVILTFYMIIFSVINGLIVEKLNN